MVEAASPITILVIDDEPELRDELVDILTFEGFETVSAKDGLDGVEKARKHLPDLIICDVGMPEMDGFQVLETLQKDTATANIPFIFLTAFADKSNLRRGMSLGADDYLTKPFLKEDLLTAVHTRLNKQAQRQVNQLRTLSQRLISYQDSENDNTAAYLQDEVLGALTGIRMMLSTGREAERVIPIVDSLMQQTQDWVHELRPAMLRHLGLIPTLSWLARQVSSQSNIDVSLSHIDLEDLQLYHETELAAFRILQEALLNAVKHADTKKVDVRVWVENDMLYMDVTDFGTGFDLPKKLNASTTNGLLIMQERALALGGYCIVASLPGEGTSVSVGLPQQMAKPSETTLMMASQYKIAEHLTTTPTTTPPPPPTSTISVILAEENELVRQGLRHILEGSGRYSILAEVQSLRGLNNLVQDVRADLLILSYTLAENNMSQLVASLVQSYPQMRIVVMSNYAQAAFGQSVVASGAMAYMLKQSGSGSLLAALEDIEAGKQVVDRNVQYDLPKHNVVTHKPADREAYQSLTRREREILFLVLEGLQNSEIADRLVISPRTVETHRSNMMRKLNIKGQAALMRFAVQQGLIST